MTENLSTVENAKEKLEFKNLQKVTIGERITNKRKKWFQINTELEGTPEKTMAPHSSTLAWKIPWTEEPGRLQSTGSRRVRHD